MHQSGQILSSFVTHMNVGMDGANVIVRLPALTCITVLLFKPPKFVV